VHFNEGLLSYQQIIIDFSINLLDDSKQNTKYQITIDFFLSAL